MVIFSGFSLEYPKDFSLQTDYTKVKILGYLPVCDATMAACAYYTGDAYKGTNFENAGVSINILKILDSQAKCYNFTVSTNEAQTTAGTITINGIAFNSATGGDAGAGHSMKTQVYRNFHNGQCYEIAQRIGITNIGNYTPGTIKEFDQSALWQRLQGIVSSFVFSSTTQAQSSATFGKTISLKKGEIVKFPDGGTVTVTGFYNKPCPKGVNCIWSGQDVYYSVTANGKQYKKDKIGAPSEDFPYVVTIGKSDYSTYAELTVVPKKPISKLQICPDEWWENDMPTMGQTNATQQQYYIYKGQRHEITEFDAAWVAANCNITLQHAA